MSAEQRADRCPIPTQKLPDGRDDLMPQHVSGDDSLKSGPHRSLRRQRVCDVLLAAAHYVSRLRGRHRGWMASVASSRVRARSACARNDIKFCRLHLLACGDIPRNCFLARDDGCVMHELRYLATHDGRIAVID